MENYEDELELERGLNIVEENSFTFFGDYFVHIRDNYNRYLFSGNRWFIEQEGSNYSRVTAIASINYKSPLNSTASEKILNNPEAEFEIKRMVREIWDYQTGEFILPNVRGSYFLEIGNTRLHFSVDPGQQGTNGVILKEKSSEI